MNQQTPPAHDANERGPLPPAAGYLVGQRRSNASARPTGGTSAAQGVNWRKAALRFVLYLLLTPASLFLAAGRLDWGWAWGYVGMLFAVTAISRLIVLRRNPELLAERARSLEAGDVKGWDRLLVPLGAVLGPLAMCVVAGLDLRFGWSAGLPLAVHLAGTALVALGFGLGTWAMVANPFFSAVVRIQKDRGHAVATGGPYRLVRHPAYAGAVLGYLASPLMLGSWWALIPAALASVTVFIRTALEDRTLHEELPGYAEYAQRTPYRLLPGVW